MKIKAILNVVVWVLVFSYLSFSARAIESGQMGNNSENFDLAKIKEDPLMTVNLFNKYWMVVVMILIIFLLAMVFYLFWKKYQKKYYGGEGWIKYEVGDGDTVQGLIKKYGVNWKVFIKTNKIKKPYILEEGQIIKIPSAGEDLMEEELFSVESDIRNDENLVDFSKKGEKTPVDLNKEVDELSDEDILNRKELFDSSFENKKTKEVESGECSTLEKTVVSDGVDSSLFVVSNNIKKKETLEMESEKKEIEKEIKEVFLVSEDTQSSNISAQPLKKNIDIKKSKVLSVESSATEEESKEKGLIIEDDDIIIRGNKNDTKNYFKWVSLSLGLIILILLGAVIYLLLNTREEEKIVSQPAPITVENTELIISQENIAIQEKKEEPTQEEINIDSLKMKVDVFNGSGVAGAAGKVKDFLESKKYENVEAKDYPKNDFVGSTIYYKEDNLKEKAQWLADILRDKDIDADIKLAPSDEEKSADFVIILGK